MESTTSQPIAQHLASQQEEISVAEFFEQNRQMLGFGSNARALVTAVKEAVDNSIDAAEEAGTLPTISVDIRKSSDNLIVTVTDNGPGITKEQIPKIFGKLLYGSRFGKRSQSRGQQGIGISAAVLYSQLTTGKPTTITSKTAANDHANQYEVRIDTDTNEPIIIDTSTTTWDNDFNSGTEISLTLEANFRARTSLHDYIRYTSVVNPHVTLKLTEPKTTLTFDRKVSTVPDQPEEIQPHPHGIELGTLQSLLETTDSYSVSGFLQTEFTRVGETTANKIIDTFIDKAYGRQCRWITPPADTTDNKLSTSNLLQYISPDSITTEEGGNNSGGDPPITEYNHLSEDQYVKSTPVETLKQNINRKPHDVTKEFANQVWENLEKQSPVTYETVKHCVEETAKSVSDTHNITLGETVQDHVIEAAWNEIRKTAVYTLYQIIDESTSDKKPQNALTVFTVSLSKYLLSSGSNKDILTKDQLISQVRKASDTAKSETGVPFGETAQEKVINAIWEHLHHQNRDPPNTRDISGDRELTNALHEAMQETSVMAPPSTCLSPIGEDELIAGLKKVYDAEFYTASQRDADSHSGEPFIVEAGIAYGGNITPDGSIELLRFANRVPLVYQQGAGCISSVTSDIRWNNYKLSHKGNNLPQGPVSLVVHVGSTNVPFTSESKDALASVDVIKKEIERAIRDVALDMKKHIKKQATVKRRKEKQEKVVKILPEFSEKVAGIVGKEATSIKQSMARILNTIHVTHTCESNKHVIQAINYTNSETRTPDIHLVIEGNQSAISSLLNSNSVLHRNEENCSKPNTQELVWKPTLTESEKELSLPEGITVTNISMPMEEQNNQATIVNQT